MSLYIKNKIIIAVIYKLIKIWIEITPKEMISH